MNQTERENNSRTPKIKIGVSSCLLGEKVRYDGTHRQNDILFLPRFQQFELVAVCPELEAGFGVPREPVQLTMVDGIIRVLGRESQIDRTEQLGKYISELVASDRISSLSGFILKAKSPSCGGDKVKLFGESGQFVRQGVGLFAEALIKKQPDLPTIDEKQLAAEQVCQQFIARVIAYHEKNCS